MPSEVNQCHLCSAPASGFRPFERVRSWDYVQCSRCGLVLLNPRPTDAELEHFYNHSYRYDLKRYTDSISRQKVWLDLLEEVCGDPGTLLEVGCSYGHFLAEARGRGWKVRGIELSGVAVEFGRGALGLPIDQGRILDCKERGAADFDTIAAWHVLEHDPVPREFVETAFELLRPGGILALRVPNLGSTVAKLSGPDWQWLSPPEHVCMYTRETLSLLLKQSNFEIVTTRTERGNARNMWFEILRARAKQSLRRPHSNGSDSNGNSYSFVFPTVYEDRAWYRLAEQAMSLGTLPFDWACTRWLAGKGREAELAMVARKPAREPLDRAIPERDLQSTTI
jgi:2-polyprenyl-3-methyl-5-hydroxy-6-metoxy-1,4-benzoquinol methylase